MEDTAYAVLDDNDVNILLTILLSPIRYSEHLKGSHGLNVGFLGADKITSESTTDSDML